MPPPTIPFTIQVRLSSQQREALGNYMRAVGISNMSAAVRTLLGIALKSEGESADEVFRRAAFREGVVSGAAKLKKRIEDAIHATLSEM